MSEPNSKASILLVEDEENLHEALKLNLELEGYDVTSAMDGAAALKAVQSEYFDLIILDVMLPEMDGIAVTETVRISNNEVNLRGSLRYNENSVAARNCRSVFGATPAEWATCTATHRL